MEAATRSRERVNKESLFDIEIPLPPLDIQRKIARVLDQAQTLIDKRKDQIALLEGLAESEFLDMFGDPLTNPRGWRTSRLGDLADIVSGVTKGRKIASSETVTVPYMRVANVQDGRLDLSEIKDIEVTTAELHKYNLVYGDILMTEGGDPDKLGRGAIWRNELEPCIHQNHIFRVRLKDVDIIPDYFCRLVGSAYGKRYFLRAAKQTTGIATINATQLRDFPILMPPISLQKEFGKIVGSIAKQLARFEQSLAEMETLYQSLMQQAFRGELFGGTC